MKALWTFKNETYNILWPFLLPWLHCTYDEAQKHKYFSPECWELNTRPSLSTPLSIFWAWQLLLSLVLICCFKLVQRFSMMFRSGELRVHLSHLKLTWSWKARVDLALCTRAPSCWKKEWISCQFCLSEGWEGAQFLILWQIPRPYWSTTPQLRILGFQ
jgi:hypothetical protein